MEAYLVLGCNGHIDKNGMVYCNSVSNPILDLSKIPEDKKDKLLSFLENGCKLFDSPCHDQNMVGNIINLMHKNFSVINEPLIPSIQMFLKMHKVCGLYLALILKEDYDVRK